MANPLYFGGRDVNVKITAETVFVVQALNKCILITDEEDIPIQQLSGDNAVAELNQYLADNTLTAPVLVEAVTRFVSQTDVDGNPLLPEYLYVIGVDEVDSSANVDLLTAAIELAEQSSDFYMLVPTFESVPMNTWLASWCNTKRRVYSIFTQTKNKALADPELSIRGIGIYDGQTTAEHKNSAFAGRCMTPGIIGWKYRTLSGCNVDVLPDGDVTALEAAGWNGYRKTRGRNVTTGSRTLSNNSDVNSFISTIIVRDNIVYNVAGALFEMFYNNEIIGMGDGDGGRELVESTIATTLQQLVDLGYIARQEDGSGAFRVSVPEITGVMRSIRDLSGVTFEYEATIAMETIKVTGEELLDFA